MINVRWYTKFLNVQLEHRLLCCNIQDSHSLICTTCKKNIKKYKKKKKKIKSKSRTKQTYRFHIEIIHCCAFKTRTLVIVL